MGCWVSNYGSLYLQKRKYIKIGLRLLEEKLRLVRRVVSRGDGVSSGDVNTMAHYYFSLASCYMVSCGKSYNFFVAQFFLDLFSLSYYIISPKFNKKKEKKKKREINFFFFKIVLKHLIIRMYSFMSYVEFHSTFSSIFFFLLFIESVSNLSLSLSLHIKEF